MSDLFKWREAMRSNFDGYNVKMDREDLKKRIKEAEEAGHKLGHDDYLAGRVFYRPRYTSTLLGITKGISVNDKLSHLFIHNAFYGMLESGLKGEIWWETVPGIRILFSVGDILTNDEGGRAEVMAICGKLVAMRYIKENIEFRSTEWWTVEDVIKMGYKKLDD